MASSSERNVEKETRELRKTLTGMSVPHWPIPVRDKVTGARVEGFSVLLVDAYQFAEFTRRTRNLEVSIQAHDLADTLYTVNIRP